MEFPYDEPRSWRDERNDPPRQVSARQRRFFVGSILVLALACGYTSLRLLTRVTPALFPGQELSIPLVQEAVAALPGPVAIEQPGADSVFNRRISILVMGLDQRFGQEELAMFNTDTVMLASVDPVSARVTVLGFPRDMLITITNPDGSSYEDRINTSFAIGAKRRGSEKDGAEQLMRDMEKNFGVPIDHWVILDFEGVEAMVDSLGGIDVYVPADLAVPRHIYSDDDQNPREIEIKPGQQHLDGYLAVALGRYRETDDDFHRMRRQQIVLTAAMQRVFERNILSNPLSLWDRYEDLLETDVPKGKLPGYALLLRKTQGEMTNYLASDPVNGVQTVFDATTPYGGAVLRWDVDNVQYWIDRLLGVEEEPLVGAEGAGSRTP